MIREKNFLLEGKHQKPIVTDVYFQPTQHPNLSLFFVTVTKVLKIGARGIWLLKNLLKRDSSLLNSIFLIMAGPQKTRSIFQI
jgi:hypothetical protein